MLCSTMFSEHHKNKYNQFLEINLNCEFAGSFLWFVGYVLKNILNVLITKKLIRRIPAKIAI